MRFSKNFPELLNGPFRRWMFGHIESRIRRESISIATKTYTIRNVAVADTKKSHATIAFA
jgi:hypothetical protein